MDNWSLKKEAYLQGLYNSIYYTPENEHVPWKSMVGSDVF